MRKMYITYTYFFNLNTPFRCDATYKVIFGAVFFPLYNLCPYRSRRIELVTQLCKHVTW